MKWYKNIYINIAFSLKNETNICIKIFSFKKDKITIGHHVTFINIQFLFDIWKYSQRTINNWNTLSADCVTVSSSVNMFKIKIDTNLRRVDYTWIKHVGFSLSQWLPCPFAIWVFGLDGNLVIY